jgi:hypothetical protein
MEEICKSYAEVEAIISNVKGRKSFLKRATIIKAIAICCQNPTDNLGRTIGDFNGAVYYRANQIWLAIGS